jgi:hypothetical protein
MLLLPELSARNHYLWIYKRQLSFRVTWKRTDTLEICSQFTQQIFSSCIVYELLLIPFPYFSSLPNQIDICAL